MERSILTKANFKSSGNGWVALGFFVVSAIGAGILLIVNSWSLIGWIAAIVGGYFAHWAWPRDAETNRARAERAMTRRELARIRAAERPRTVRQPSLTISQSIDQLTVKSRVKKAEKELQKGNLLAIVPLLANQSALANIDRMRYWNPLPSRIEIEVLVLPDLVKFGSESIDRRLRSTLLFVSFDRNSTIDEPCVVLATSDFSVIGAVPVDIAQKMTPYLEAGGYVFVSLKKVKEFTSNGEKRICVVVIASPLPL